MKTMIILLSLFSIFVLIQLLTILIKKLLFRSMNDTPIHLIMIVLDLLVVLSIPIIGLAGLFKNYNIDKLLDFSVKYYAVVTLFSIVSLSTQKRKVYWVQKGSGKFIRHATKEEVRRETQLSAKEHLIGIAFLAIFFTFILICIGTYYGWKAIW